MTFRIRFWPLAGFLFLLTEFCVFLAIGFDSLVGDWSVHIGAALLALLCGVLIYMPIESSYQGGVARGRIAQRKALAQPLYDAILDYGSVCGRTKSDSLELIKTPGSILGGLIRSDYLSTEHVGTYRVALDSHDTLLARVARLEAVEDVYLMFPSLVRTLLGDIDHVTENEIKHYTQKIIQETESLRLKDWSKPETTIHVDAPLPTP